MLPRWFHNTLTFPTVLIIAIIAAVFAASTCYDENQRYLEFKVNIPEQSWGHLYFAVTATKQLKESKSVKIDNGAKQTRISLPLVNVPFEELHFHINYLNGDATFADFQIVNRRGNILHKLPITSLQPFPNRAFIIKGDNLIVRSVPFEQGAYLRIPVQSQSYHHGKTLALLSKYFSLYASLLFILFMGINYLVRRFPITSMDKVVSALPAIPWSIACRLQVTGVFLAILGARLWLIRSFGSDIPFADQWEAEALNLYIPYFDGNLSWQHWLQPHNEHRLLLTRMIMLPLLLINNYWDAQLQMVLNALLYSGIGAMVFKVIAPSTPRRMAWAMVVVILFSLPFGWENTLSGFQLQFYLMIGLSLLILWLLPNNGFGDWKWWTGALCAVLVLFTIASGLLACLTVLMIIIVEITKDRTADPCRKLIPTAMLCALVVVAGIMLVPHVAAHERLQAHSAGEFMLSVVRSLAWPLADYPLFAIIQWLPITLLFVNYFKTSQTTARIRFICGLGLFVLLQAAAIAYARGGLTSWPESRYQDILSLGILANAFALLSLITKEKDWCKTGFVRYLCLFWLILNCAGFTYLTRSNFVHDLPSKKSYQKAGKEILGNFLVSNRIETLVYSPRNDLPYHDPVRLAIILRNPDMSKRLPPGLGSAESAGRLKPLCQYLLVISRWLLIIGVVSLLGSLTSRSRSNPG